MAIEHLTEEDREFLSGLNKDDLGRCMTVIALERGRMLTGDLTDKLREWVNELNGAWITKLPYHGLPKSLSNNWYGRLAEWRMTEPKGGLYRELRDNYKERPKYKSDLKNLDRVRDALQRLDIPLGPKVHVIGPGEDNSDYTTEELLKLLHQVIKERDALNVRVTELEDQLDDLDKVHNTANGDYYELERKYEESQKLVAVYRAKAETVEDLEVWIEMTKRLIAN